MTERPGQCRALGVGDLRHVGAELLGEVGDDGLDIRVRLGRSEFGYQRGQRHSPRTLRADQSDQSLLSHRGLHGESAQPGVDFVCGHS